jgi:DNA-binding transcriptional MerR regulator
MTLAELADRLGVEPRQIRFLIAEGIVPAAQKTGRSADAYDETHLTRAQRYLALHRMGMKPASIKVLMAFDDAVPILQTAGVEVRVAPSADAGTIDIDAVAAQIAAALRTYFGKD